jgi:tRNA modification GTPase
VRPPRAAPDDTIVALATAVGPGARAIVRLSGPACSAILKTVFSPADALPPPPGRFVGGAVSLPGVTSPLPADVFFWRGPNSYTGQDVAELHVISCVPLVELLVSSLLKAGARAAGTGEFTQRAFLSGKLDLTRAEAVGAVIDAVGRAELRQALGQLAGGMSRPLHEVREDLLDLLADVEAALDFADEDIRFVEGDEILLRLGRAMARVILTGKQLDSRAVASETFRVALAGRPNAGKSSLFNVLCGATALVSDEPGTTRDYLSRRMKLDGVEVELIDSPGWRQGEGPIERQAQELGRRQQEEADLTLVCVEAGTAPDAEERAVLGGERPALLVATKCDLRGAESGLATSAVTGMGLAALKEQLRRRAQERPAPALAPSVARCRHHVAACLEHLRRAHALVLEQDPPEILALELREALHQLGELAGAVYTDDLLDRVFSRFCIGK